MEGVVLTKRGYTSRVWGVVYTHDEGYTFRGEGVYIARGGGGTRAKKGCT